MKNNSNKKILDSIVILLLLFSISIKAQGQEISRDVLSNAYNNQVIDYGQVIYGTLIVLVILGLAIYVLKKTRLNKFGQHGAVEIISSFPVTTKDKLLIIRAGHEYLLLGVSSGGISKIHTLSENDIEKLSKSNDSQMKSFSSIYAATIGKFHNA